ncbi:MAG: aminotransferase class III-fold pyridoxal phosphate-dependent enzyme, partial [Pyrinomonadaceae bacterium]
SLRELCTAEGILLIFDEVMSGFRVARGGAQELYDIKPDLTTFGKIIGGGLPVGAYGGRHEIMELIAPAGPVYQAGTLSGNPLAMSAGIETLRIIDEDSAFYQRIEDLGSELESGFREVCQEAGVPATLNRCGSMFTLFFTDGPVTNFDSAKTSDIGRFVTYFSSMLEGGVYLPPSQFEACFISAAHSDGDIRDTVSAARSAISMVEGRRV